MDHPTDVCAIVEHDYVAKEPDELSLIRGSIIRNIKMQPGGWWEGTLESGRTGMFPDNFVRILEPEEKNPVVLRDKSATLNRRCKVVYSYTQENNDELTLAVGDIVEFLGEVEEGWWRGKLNGKTGVFPSNFVVTIDKVSPMLANRRSINTVARNTSKPTTTNTTKNVTITSNMSGPNNTNMPINSITSSREDLLSATDKNAPSLPPKPVKEVCKVLFPYKPTNEDELEIKEGEVITIISKDLPDKGWWKGELRGRIGLFPDNFVTTIQSTAISPVTAVVRPERPTTSPGKHINSTNRSVSLSASTTRRESFGSKDSLSSDNQNGMIGQQLNSSALRKSIDHKSNDFLSSSNTSSLEKSLMGRLNASPPDVRYPSSDIRKSLENLDDHRKSTPPPLLTKKPSIPLKKSPTAGNVATNLFSGLKKKANQSNDSLDGIGLSKSASLSDTNRKESSGDFDSVERGTILQDPRASRAKAPKRRPPTQPTTTTANTIDSIHETNLTNGDKKIESITNHSDPSEFGGEDDTLALKQPKSAKEWEKHKVPWMDELKANQAKKSNDFVLPTLTNPNVNVTQTNRLSIDKDMSGTLITTTKSSSHIVSNDSHIKKPTSITSNVTNPTTNSSTLNETSNSLYELRKPPVDQTITVSSNNLQQRRAMAHTDNLMSKSMVVTTNPSPTISTTATTTVHTATIDSNSISSISNIISVSNIVKTRSISPAKRPPTTTQPTTTSTNVQSVKAVDFLRNKPEPIAKPDNINIIDSNTKEPINLDNVCARTTEMEQRILKLERLVESQSCVIQDLTTALHNESERVRLLRGELEKYAQCVTQV